MRKVMGTEIQQAQGYGYLIPTQAKCNLSSRCGIGGVLSAT